jgi:3'(2'), 5'-bisphosphate nucleotidase
MSNETYMTLAKRLVQSVRDAGKEIMQIHAAGVVADTKADGSPVTMADEAAEAILLHALREMAPDIAVISEENAESHRLAPPDRFFLVDPLDGTKEFLRPDGQGAFTVNIGLVEMGVPVIGIVYAPALDRLFYGVVGQGATEMSAGNVRDIGVRPVPASGAIAVASRSHRDAATNQWLETHGINDTIATGSSLKFCLVAAGEADVYPRFGPTMEWDTAAGDAVLRAAGGRVIHPEGMPFTYGKTEYRNGGFVACGAFVPTAVG